jgi:ligand-binding sensor domain-containing protein
MKPTILIFLFIWLAAVDALQAQSYSSVHYDTRDGLPSATVYDVSQDKDGFVWFATENGLCRFDGKNFRTFTTKDGLPDNSILRVHGDNAGKLLFTPFTHGLYYFQNDSFYKIPIPEKYKLDLSIVTFFSNMRDRVIVSGLTNSYILDSNGLISFHDKFNVGEKTSFTKRVFDTLLIISSHDSIFFVDGSGTIRANNYSRALRDEDMYDDSLHVRKMKIPKELIGIPGSFVGQNLMYYIRGDEVSFFSLSTGELAFKIRAKKFSSAYFDNENNLWISTLGDGVYRFPSFKYVNVDFNGRNEIFSLIKNGDRVLAGSDFSELYEIPLQSNNGDYTTTDYSRYLNTTDNPVARYTKRNRIYVLRAEGSDLYIGTDAFVLKKNGPRIPLLKDIFPIKDIDIVGNHLLICTGYGVLLTDRISMKVTDTLLRQRATCGSYYKGKYYIGTLGGLIRIDSVSKKIEQLYNVYPSFKGRITAIKRGMNDDLWIATSGFGLNHFKDDKIIQVLGTEEGLSSDICTTLFIDGSLLWLGTNTGLNRIQTGKEKPGITRFTVADGLGADFINAILTTDSNIYVGTAAGLTIFSKTILTEKSVCILHILKVSENNLTLKKDSAYTFPYNTLNIRVDFTAVSFKSGGDIVYSYQLEGLDKRWNTTTANFVNFPTLQPGGYTLLLKAVNKFGVQSETKKIRIDIRPPWWATLPFRVAALLVTGLLILFIYRYNIRSVKRKQELKRDFETRFAALEQKALQAQMNPHFIFNALNSIQTFILNLDAEGANNYLTKFASLIRQTLENSMHSLIPVVSEIQYIETYLKLEKLRFRDKFEYRVEVDESIDQNNTLLPGMLLQPYIENSIRHGIQHRKDNNGLVFISAVKTAGHAVLYTIQDNGVGRKTSELLKSSRHIEYQSRGTSINEKRVAAINIQFKTSIRVDIQDVVDEKGNVTGTSVTILIPPLQKQ